jgi:hypothetical protein
MRAMVAAFLPALAGSLVAKEAQVFDFDRKN